MRFFDVQTPYLKYKKEIDSAVTRVLESGQYVMGPEVQAFEEELARFAGVKHAIGVANGTDSLQIALMALGVGPGDEVITVPFTFFATAEAIRLVGAKPVFVDIDPKTFNMDPSLLKGAITEKTAAIIPVSLYGRMADLEAINAIAGEIPVIEDAAQSLGVGCNRTTIASTSFYPTKVLGGFGDGGALLTNDDGIAERIGMIRVHGSRVRDQHLIIGMNSRLDALQAAMLRVKLAHLGDEIVRRKEIAQAYNEAFGLPHVEDHVYGLYTIRVAERDRVREEIGVPTAAYYSEPLHVQEALADLGYREGNFPESERAAKEVLSLPMHPWLTEAEVEKIIERAHQALPLSV